jgi:hypothetical protein
MLHFQFLSKHMLVQLKQNIHYFKKIPSASNFKSMWVNALLISVRKHCIELQVGKSATALRTLSCGHHLYLNPGGKQNLFPISFTLNRRLTVSHSLVLLLHGLMHTKAQTWVFAFFSLVLNHILDSGGEHLVPSLSDCSAFSKSCYHMSHQNDCRWNQQF